MVAIESIKHEVLETKRSCADEFYYLGRIDYLKLVYILLNACCAFIRHCQLDRI